MTLGSKMWLWVRRITIGLLALLLLLVLVGVVYEFFARRSAASQYPTPGVLVDIGGRSIHLDCRGAGTPTVVLESGLDINGSLAWHKVHDALAKTREPAPMIAPGSCGATPRRTCATAIMSRAIFMRR